MAISSFPVLFSPDVVTATGTPVANFADKNVGDDKVVTVTGYTLGGVDAGNYTLTQPIGIESEYHCSVACCPYCKYHRQQQSL